MLATCGLDNVDGGTQTDPMNQSPIYGRIYSRSAEQFCSDVRWEDKIYLIVLSGTMRESRLFGRSPALHKQITSSLDAAEVTIANTITNLPAAPEPVFMLYHFNFGYPLPDEDARDFGPQSVMSQYRNVVTHDFRTIHPPQDIAEHQAVCHIPYENGIVTAGLYQPKQRLVAYLRYVTTALPYLLELKCLKLHDNVLASERTNCPAVDRVSDLQCGKSFTLGTYESATYQIILGFTEDSAAESLLKNNE